MAKLPNSAVVLRFRIGSGLVKARQRYENTSRAILERVALQYAEGQYDNIRKDIQWQLERDLRFELEHIGILFQRHIVGFAGRRTSPSGTLDTAVKGEGAPSMPIAMGLPPWAPRNAQYIKQKRRATGHMRWFDNTGWQQGPDLRYARRMSHVGEGPDNPGLLRSELTKDVWEAIFGPISVRFFRSRTLKAGDQTSTLSAKGSKHMKIQVGSLQVRALGKITPAMLPGYTSGTVRATDKYNGSLLNVIGDYDPRLAYRLGRMNNGVYRPTLEPFLGFYLTKAIPFLVSRRLEKGSLGTLFK